MKLKVAFNLAGFCIWGLAVGSPNNIQFSEVKETPLGKVKTITTLEYEAHGTSENVIKGNQTVVSPDDYNFLFFDSLGHLSQESSLGRDSSILRFKLYKYDNKDSLIEASVFNPDSTLLEKTNYKRDKKHRAIEISFLNGKGLLKTSYAMVYNDTNLTMEWVARNDKNELNKILETPKEVIHFNKNKDIKEIDHYTFINPTTMILGTKSRFKYDSNKHLKEITHHFRNDSIREKISYYYNQTGKLDSLVDEEFYFSHRLKNRTLMKYNANENMDTIMAVIPSEKKTELKTYKYKYDSAGNWIERIEFLNSSPVKITERKIEYYTAAK